jgi:hypothetical protein
MKRYIAAGIATIGCIVAVYATSNNNIQIKPKQELPEVLVSANNPKKTYSYNISFEINPPPCTRNIPFNTDSSVKYDGNTEGDTMELTHCKSCSMGVYSFHDGEKVRTCSWCKAEEGINK